jgi:hypothetical protein
LRELKRKLKPKRLSPLLKPSQNRTRLCGCQLEGKEMLRNTRAYLLCAQASHFLVKRYFHAEHVRYALQQSNSCYP